MKRTTDGLVIWQTRTGEADRVITILTPDGVITAYAKGSLRPKNKLTASTALLSYSNFELFSGKNMYTVDDAECINRFIRLEADVRGYAYASYFCELMKLLAPVEDDAREYLLLLLNALYLINAGKKDLELLKSAFELRLSALAGYMPDLDRCAGCSREAEGNVAFDIENGVWYCADCLANVRRRANCSPAMLAAMRHIISCEPKRVFSFEIGEGSKKALSALCSAYIVGRLERTPATLNFLTTIAT